MITVTVDTQKEFFLMNNLIETGAINWSMPHLMEYLGISLVQKVKYKKTENYVDDLDPEIDKLNKEFPGLGLSEVETILVQRAQEREKKDD